MAHRSSPAGRIGFFSSPSFLRLRSQIFPSAVERDAKVNTSSPVHRDVERGAQKEAKMATGFGWRVRKELALYQFLTLASPSLTTRPPRFSSPAQLHRSHPLPPLSALHLLPSSHHCTLASPSHASLLCRLRLRAQQPLRHQSLRSVSPSLSWSRPLLIPVRPSTFLLRPGLLLG